MAELKVPYALGLDNHIYSPIEAEKGKEYFCPSCHRKVILKQGLVKVPHFAHYVEIDPGQPPCNQETIIHKTAKYLIQKAVHDWKAGIGQCPILATDCVRCYKPVEGLCPTHVDGALLELTLPEGYRADVALMSAGIPLIIVEVRVSHSVSSEKATNLSVPYIEVDGYEILECHTRWQSITDTVMPKICDACQEKERYRQLQIEAQHKANLRAKQEREERLRSFQREVMKVAQKYGVTLPDRFYRYTVARCQKCGAGIVMFIWPGSNGISNARPPYEPIPQSIQMDSIPGLNYSSWMNRCPSCKAYQGIDAIRQAFSNDMLDIVSRRNPQEDMLTDDGFLRDMEAIARYGIFPSRPIKAGMYSKGRRRRWH